MGYSPLSHKELDTTEATQHTACVHAYGLWVGGGAVLLQLFKASAPSWEGLMGNRILIIILL